MKFTPKKYMRMPGKSRFLVKTYSLMLYSKRLLLCIVAIIFVLTTTHLIFMEPIYRQPMTKAMFQKSHLNKRSISDEGQRFIELKSCHKFVIFDADNFHGNMSFLEKPHLGWCVIVLNLNDSTQLSTCKDCLSLKDEWVRQNVMEFIENKHGRNLDLTYSQLSKMAAYVFALLHGAEWIYVTDRPLAIPYYVFSKLTELQVKTGPVYQGPEKIFEPCTHFMDSLTWRRRDSRQGQGRYNIKVVSPQSIYQVVDSCMKPGIDEDVHKKSFDSEAPIPYIMPGTYAAIDFRNVLVSRENIWSLVASLFPRDHIERSSKISLRDDFLSSKSIKENNISSDNTSTYYVTLDVELNMMIQRILWETDTRIGFIPHVSMESVPRDPWKSICSTCDAYTQLSMTTKKYRDGLLAWRCDSFHGVTDCLSQLASYGKVVNKTLKTLVYTWISLLDKHSIISVDRIPFSYDKIIEKHTGIPLYFSAAKVLKKHPTNDTVPLNPFGSLCKNYNSPYHPVIPDKYPITKILLIIVFNFPFLVSHIPLLDYVYGRHFKHVLYCSENITDFEQRYQRANIDRPVSYIEIKHYMGYWGQNCMSAAIKIGYDITGYLQISDDVLMNIWNFDKLPYRQPWFQSNMKVAHVDHEVVPDVWVNRYWWPWTQFSGKKSAVAALKHLESLLPNPDDGDKVSAFMKNLYDITNCDRCFLYEASDIFYLPQELGSNFTFFSDIFSYNKVFLEITIPTVLAGITSDREVYRLRGNYLWFHDRQRYPFVYREFDHFYHAWKFSLFGDKRQVRFFCRQFLAKVDDHLMKEDQENTFGEGVM